MKVESRWQIRGIIYNLPYLPYKRSKKKKKGHIEDSKQKTHWRLDNIFNINANNLNIHHN